MPTEADSLHAQPLYYRYDKPKPFVRRLISLGRAWPVYCERCATPVSIGSLVMGIAISDASLKAPAESAVVQRLRDKDWSMLNGAHPPTHWSPPNPKLFIELGRCDGCGGPFCAFGKVQGVASDNKNTLLIGDVFLGELDTREAAALLETALNNDLFANDDYWAKAIATCKTLDRTMDFDRCVRDRETRRAAMQLGQRAMLDVQRGKLEGAQEALQSALQTFTELGNKRLQSATMMHLASVQIRLANLDEAEQLLQHALPLMEELGNAKNAAVCVGLLGTIYQQRGEFDQAESMFRRALQTASEASDKADMGVAYSTLGGLYEAQNRHGQARDAYSEALKLYQQLGARESAKSIQDALSRLST